MRWRALECWLGRMSSCRCPSKREERPASKPLGSAWTVWGHLLGLGPFGSSPRPVVPSSLRTVDGAILQPDEAARDSGYGQSHSMRSALTGTS
jgi:hypothetical protein